MNWWTTDSILNFSRSIQKQPSQGFSRSAAPLWRHTPMEKGVLPGSYRSPIASPPPLCRRNSKCGNSGSGGSIFRNHPPPPATFVGSTWRPNHLRKQNSRQVENLKKVIFKKKLLCKIFWLGTGDAVSILCECFSYPKMEVYPKIEKENPVRFLPYLPPRDLFLEIQFLWETFRVQGTLVSILRPETSRFRGKQIKASFRKGTFSDKSNYLWKELGFKRSFKILKWSIFWYTLLFHSIWFLSVKSKDRPK